jgi:hypothetical protein
MTLDQILKLGVQDDLTDLRQRANLSFRAAARELGWPEQSGYGVLSNFEQGVKYPSTRDYLHIVGVYAGLLGDDMDPNHPALQLMKREAPRRRVAGIVVPDPEWGSERLFEYLRLVLQLAAEGVLDEAYPGVRLAAYMIRRGRPIAAR